MVKVGETSAPVVETVGPALYPRLDRKDYGLWALNMEVAMEAAEIWEAVDPGGNDYVKGGAKYTKDRKALTAIYSVVPKDVMQHLVGKKSAKDAWETIKTLHQGHARVREAHLQTLTKSYEDLKMEESETVDQFAARFVTLINAIRGYGERLDEVKNVRRFLRAAPARHMQIVTSIEQCLDLNTLTVEDLVGRFKAHDERIRLSFDDPDQSEHLMLTKQQWMTLSKEKQGGSTSRSNGKEKQRPAKKYIAEEEEDDEAPPRRKFDIKKVRCHKCGKLGHFKSDCREPPKERAFMAQQGDDGPMMLMLEECEQMDKEELGPPVSAMEIVTLVEEKVYLHDKRGTKTGGNVWCLDTGASNHMTGDKSLFSELDLSVGGTVRFGDGSTVDIAGRGNVLLEMQYGGPKVLTNVYYIPKLKRNIISLGTLAERGCKIVIEDDYLWGYDRQRKLMMKVERSKNRLYYLDLDRVDTICDGFVVGKQRNAPFPRGSTFVTHEGGIDIPAKNPEKRHARYMPRLCQEVLNFAVASINEGCTCTGQPEGSATLGSNQASSSGPRWPEVGGPEGSGSPGEDPSGGLAKGEGQSSSVTRLNNALDVRLETCGSIANRPSSLCVVKPEEAPREELDPEKAPGAHVPEGIGPVRRCLGQKDRPETYELEDGSFKERSEISVASHASHERKLAFFGKLRELATRYMFSFGQEYRPAVNRVGYSSTREDFVEREYLFTKEEVKAEDADKDGNHQAMEKPVKRSTDRYRLLSSLTPESTRRVGPVLTKTRGLTVRIETRGGAVSATEASPPFAGVETLGMLPRMTHDDDGGADGDAICGGSWAWAWAGMATKRRMAMEKAELSVVWLWPVVVWKKAQRAWQPSEFERPVSLPTLLLQCHFFSAALPPTAVHLMDEGMKRIAQ
ncbi:hypothetical protein QYE76_052452 [Lolium multiflorum]|uniref:CCHC-type domain-containing protein n=1 Tax=Lolium multiflorum TaxID=4521 RepID=A0AAD8SVM7_LOLMU|nr:hypothetical protein QYE76_052452 [Lolium multiflorum]